MLVVVMTTMARFRPVCLATLAVLAVAGCSRPEWTNPDGSKGSRALPPPPAKPAIPTDPGGAPATPGWVVPLLGKPLRTAFPRDGVCQGNTDAIARIYEGAPTGGLIVGWAWEFGAKAPVPRVVLVDPAGTIIGGGDSGYTRADVPPVVPAVTSDKSGWQAVSPVTSGRVNAYGVVEDGQAICVLAGVDF